MPTTDALRQASPARRPCLLPRSLWLLLSVYFCASLLHFSHNAEFMASYPNMPHWLTREKVYLAWLAVSGVGMTALVLTRAGAPVLGALLLAAYGALGLGGLGHFALALCSQHTLATQLTIWFEVVTGLVLCLSCAVLAKRRFDGSPYRRSLACALRERAHGG